MMEGISGYLLSVMAAAIVCAIVKRLLEGKGAAAAVGKMLCGVFLLFTMIAPLTDITLLPLGDITDVWQAEAADAIAQGENSARAEWERGISDRVEAYILDKAAQYGAQLTVTVALGSDAIPLPQRVTIQGNISPYGKTQLQSWIAENLGIAKEDQVWI